MRSWIEFWDGDHAIYAGDRHKALNARWVARDVGRFIPHQDATVLDFGCGEALQAGLLARQCGKLILCDGAPNVRRGLEARYAHEPRITVAAPEELHRLPDGALDLVVVNSVLQYLDRHSLTALLETWGDKLAHDGHLVLSDVIPPGVSKLADAGSLLRFAWQGGFVMSAVAGLARTACSDYGRLRKQVGFSTYDEADLLALLRRHGFEGERVHPNVGHNQARMTFVAAKRLAAGLSLQAAE